ncbi:uncharacterized protein [Ambystoma mexicanum]|uniref:uncharacterized protein n=1 Tax=Ambystoma mexicanum TaxID=8296 RepID=UPI0037E703F1
MYPRQERGARNAGRGNRNMANDKENYTIQTLQEQLNYLRRDNQRMTHMLKDFEETQQENRKLKNMASRLKARIRERNTRDNHYRRVNERLQEQLSDLQGDLDMWTDIAEKIWRKYAPTDGKRDFWAYVNTFMDISDDGPPKKEYEEDNQNTVDDEHSDKDYEEFEEDNQSTGSPQPESWEEYPERSQIHKCTKPALVNQAQQTGDPMIEQSQQTDESARPVYVEQGQQTDEHTKHVYTEKCQQKTEQTTSELLDGALQTKSCSETVTRKLKERVRNGVLLGFLCTSRQRSQTPGGKAVGYKRLK